MRQLIFKVELKFDSGTSAIITVATPDRSRVIPFVYKNRMFFEKSGKIIGHAIVDQLITLNMPEKQYEEEVSYCDLVDEELGIE